MVLPGMLGAGERGPVRVLVGDVDPDSTRTITELRANGYDVKSARGHRTTLSMVEKFRPDLVLLDIEAAGQGGIEVGREIRRMVLPREPALIASSGRISPASMRECASAGFDHFLVKPVATREIVQLADLVRIAPKQLSEFDSLLRKFEAGIQTFIDAQLAFCALVLDSLQHHSNEVLRRRQILRLYRTITLADAWLVKQTGMPLEVRSRLEREIGDLRNRWGDVTRKVFE